MKAGEIPDRPLPDLRPWAARVLELEADAPARELRAAFMLRLEQEDFVSPWREQQAFHVLRSQSERPVRQALELGGIAEEEEDRLRDEIGQFADEYFSLGEEERRQRWEALWKQCVWNPALSAWLRGLERGLGVASLREETTGLGEPPAHRNELAELVAGVFVARPNLRGVRRRVILDRARQDRAAWAAAARAVQTAAPELAALEPHVFSRLLAKSKRRRQGKRAPLPGTAAPAGEPASGSRWGAVLIIVLAVGLVRAFLSSGPPSPRPVATPIPQVDPRLYRLYTAPGGGGLDDERLKKIWKEYGTRRDFQPIIVHRPTKRDTAPSKDKR